MCLQSCWAAKCSSLPSTSLSLRVSPPPVLRQNTEPSSASGLRLCSGVSQGIESHQSFLLFFLKYCQRKAGRAVLLWQGVWRGLGNAVQVAQPCSVGRSFAMGLHKAGSAAGPAGPASLHAPTGDPTPCHSLPGLCWQGWEHTQLGARAQPTLPGCTGTQTLVPDQAAPVCFPAVRRAGSGQAAHCHTSRGALER